MLKLFLANLKMAVRNKQALFWSLMFPLMFTVIFGFFFGGGSSSAGTVVLINRSNSLLAQKLEKAMTNSDLFRLQKSDNIDQAKDNLKRNKITSIVVIPNDFGEPKAEAPTKIKVIDDPANLQTNLTILSFLNQFLTQASFEVQNVKAIFSLEEEKTTAKSLTYFDFVLIGLIGMALMNSSIQGVAIYLAKYREDKIFKRLATTSLKFWKFIVAEVLARLMINLIQVSLILLIGIYGFKANIYGSISLIYLFALLGAVLFQAIGFTVAATARTTQAAEGMSIAISIPMMFLAGVFFPIDQLPSWLYQIVRYLPLAPLLRIMRTVALESASPLTDPTNIVIVLAWIILLLLVAAYKFRLAEE